MARLIRERETLTVINDQIGAPTGAELIADVTAHAIRQATGNQVVHGLYHLAVGGETSWHGYATFIAEWLHAQGVAIQAQPAAIEPVPTTSWPAPARRPLISRLERIFTSTPISTPISKAISL
jgi:dTDP-4-dehydrorhamnose reductase